MQNKNTIKVSYSKPFHGAVVNLPGSKSESNRLLVLDALNGRKTLLKGLSEARDTVVMRRCLDQMLTPGTALKELDCHDAGTVMRFMMAACCLMPGEYLLKGTERLMARPIKGLVEALRSLGARIEPQGKDAQGPWNVFGGQLKGNWVEVDGSESSQFVSALLLVAPFMGARLSVHVKGVTGSWPYIGMTLRSLSDFGVEFRQEGSLITIEPGCTPPKEIQVEADWSSAAFVYTGMGEEPVELPGLSFPSQQGDAFLAEVFPYYGIKTLAGPQTLSLQPFPRGWNIKPVTLNLANYPDLAPAVVVNALLHGQDLDIYGLESLAGKESERDQVLGDMVKACGHRWKKEKDCWSLRLKTWKNPGTLQTHNDHRMAMAFALLAKQFGEITLSEADSVEKSFPRYWKEMRGLGFSLERLP